jgi:hypothetical protein
VTGIPDIGPLAEAAETEKRRRGRPSSGEPPKPPAAPSHVGRIDQENIRFAAGALIEALRAAEASNGKLDVLTVMTRIYQRAG